MAEPGENWFNETIDGIPFDFDEQAVTDSHCESGVPTASAHTSGVVSAENRLKLSHYNMPEKVYDCPWGREDGGLRIYR